MAAGFSLLFLTSHRRRGLLVAVLLAAVSPTAQGRIWTVEKNGSGDFSVIQDAIDAAASGDTVRIGPGRFEEHRVVTTVSGGTADSHYYVRHVELTIEGAGSDRTFIGPSGDFLDVYCLVQDVSSVQLNVRGLTMDNVDCAALAGGENVSVEECTFQNVVIGICGLNSYTTAVSQCLFSGFSDRGMLLYSLPFGTPQTAMISATHFDGGRTALTSQFDLNLVSGCTIAGTLIGIGLQAGTSAQVSTTLIHSYTGAAIDISGASSLEIVDSTIGVGPVNISVFGGTLTAARVTLSGGTYRTVETGPGGQITIHDSHILNAGGLSFYAGFGDDTIRTHDVRNNWWGTADPAQIEAWIEEGAHTVLWEPFKLGPVATSKLSFGAFKARLLDGGDNRDEE